MNEVKDENFKHSVYNFSEMLLYEAIFIVN